MKVCIVAPSPVPYTQGGAERLSAGLLQAIGERVGVSAEIINLPSPERNFHDIVESYRSFSRLDLTHFDLVVSMKYPAWMIDHPRHVVYMLHPLRGVYDTYHLFALPVEPPEPLPDSVRVLRKMLSRPPERALVEMVLDQAARCVSELGVHNPILDLPSPLLRLLVRWLDSVGLAQSSVRRHLTISRTVAERAGYFPAGVQPRAVIPPSSMSVSEPGPAGERPFLFTASRLDGPKRIDMIIDSMAHVGGDVELRIAGAGPAEDSLRNRARGDDRIRFLGRISEEELSQAYADARAVVFTPFDEDLGLVTLEAQMSGTPVITVTDSGGPIELIENDVSGLIASPDPVSLGRAMRDLVSDQPKAERMGAAGKRSALKVTWPEVVDALLGEDQVEDFGCGRRRRIVILSTYPIEPAQGGGQLRCRHLLEPLGRDYEVIFVCIAFPGDPASRRTVAPGVLQIVVPRSAAHVEAESRVEAHAGIPVTDIAAAMLIDLSPEYLAELGAAVVGANLVILAHPYLFPALKMVAPELPYIYDSHNNEVELKRELLPATSVGLDLVDVVSAVEDAAVAHGTVTVCSPQELMTYSGRSLSAPVLIANGADLDRMAFTDLANRENNLRRWRERWIHSRGFDFAHLAIFVGSWHPPNLNATESILDVASSRPDTLFLIAGSQCEYFNGRQLPANVVMRGRVSDRELVHLLATADVALNPMRSGAGTNLKILEYFAAGVPVVSTEIGARGTGAVPHTHYVPLDTGTDLASAITTATDLSSTESMIRAARALVEAEFDWRVLGARFAAVVERVIAG